MVGRLSLFLSLIGLPLASALAAGSLPIHEFRLANGLKVLVLERHETPVVSNQIWYRVGSMQEPAGQTGLAHFLEHMMFKGTDRYKKGDIDKITQKLGGSNNASTSYDYTDYYFNFASDRWIRALEIEANRMKACLFDPKEVELERQVVIEERLRERDSPWGKLIEEVDSLTFTVHPYHHPVIGYVEDLKTLPRQAFMRYYQDYYNPNNATLVIVGDVDLKRLRPEVEFRFGRIPRKPLPDLPKLEEPPQECERRVTFREGANIARGVASFRVPPTGAPESVVLDVLESLLGSGKTSRLYQRLVEKEQLCSSVTVDNEGRRVHGLFQIYLELLPGKEPARVEAILMEELARTTREPVNDHELKKAKNQLSAQFVFDQETCSDLAYKIGQADVVADYRRIGSYLEWVEKLRADQVQAVAKTTFRESNRMIGWALED